MSLKEGENWLSLSRSNTVFPLVLELINGNGSMRIQWRNYIILHWRCVSSLPLRKLFNNLFISIWTHKYMYNFLLFLFFFWPHCEASGMLVLWLRIEPRPLGMRAWNPNHWTTSKVQKMTSSWMGVCLVAVNLCLFSGAPTMLTQTASSCFLNIYMVSKILEIKK